MEYRHAPAADRGDLDAVLVSAPGRPTLPVRLTLELFGRALAFVGDGPVTVWDPCCGAGTTLAVLGLCRGAAVSGLVGTDVDPSPLDLARRNLALLDPGGLDARARDLDALAERHGKPGYAAAADAARGLAGSPPRPSPTASLPFPSVPLLYEVAVADATDPAATAPLVDRHHPQMVIADLPHGVQTRWSGIGSLGSAASSGSTESPGGGRLDTGSDIGCGTRGGSGADPDAGPLGDPDPADAALQLVTALAPVLAPDTVIAVVGRGRKLALPPGTRVLDRLRVGHRAAAIVRAGDVGSAV